MNLIKIILNSLSIYVLTGGLLIYFFKNYLPEIVKQAFNYGKIAESKPSSLFYKVEFSKKRFQDFYAFSTPIAIYCSFITIRKYLYNENIPEFVYSTLDLLLGTDRKSLVSLSHATLAMILVTIQIIKRVYETQKINVFSDGKINISHYLVGYFHYCGLIAVILGESKGFHKDFILNSQDSLRTKDLIVALIFLWMSYQQLRTNIILANLRKDKKGVVVTKEHKIPRGGLFDYISAPLQFTEIGMYIALQIILNKSETYFFISLWVVINQFITGLLSHQWHRNTFKDYPPSRKIIIPYLL